eukprot:gene707-386_t
MCSLYKILLSSFLISAAFILILILLIIILTIIIIIIIKSLLMLSNIQIYIYKREALRVCGVSAAAADPRARANGQTHQMRPAKNTIENHRSSQNKKNNS